MSSANDSFVVGMTEGDRVFASYLDSQGLPYDFEQPVAGTTKRPDFRIMLNGEPSLFEVKQFDPSPEDVRGGLGHFDMYGPLREKINAAGKKFKGLKGTAPCSLVLYNSAKPFVFLGASQLYRAMLGEVRATFPIDPKTGRGDASQLKWEFQQGGKMRWYKKGTNETLRAVNTTISSIIVIDTIDIGQRRFGIITAGAAGYTCGTTLAGRGFCWGANTYGQLGDGTTTDRLIPTLIGNGLSWKEVRAGGLHTCGVALDGKAYCWGDNRAGQLGDGTQIDRLLPVPVAGP